MRGLLRTIVAGSGLVLAGCGTVPREAGFPDVQRTLAERGGVRIHWNRGGADDAAVAAEVRQMLADDLTADEAVQVALLNNRNLQATYEDLAVAQAELVQAGLLKNPIFDAEFKFHEGTGDLAFEGSIVQDFLDTLQIPLRKRIAAGQFEAVKLNVAGAVLDLALQTRTAFYTLQADQQTLEMRRTVLEAAEASYDVARRLREAGNITELDVAQQRGEYDMAKLEYATAEAGVLADRERLNVLMGLWGQDVRWKIADRMPDLPSQEPSVDGIESKAVANSLELGVFRQQIVTAGNQLGLVRPFGLLPEAEAGVAAEHEAEEGWALGPAVSVPIPLFDQGQARVATAQAGLRRARQLFAATAVEVRAEARAAAIRLRAARERADYIRRVVLPLRQRIVEQSQLQYNAMQIGVFPLLQARQQQVQAGTDYIRALRDYWLARAQLEQILSGRLPRGGGGGVAKDAPVTSGGLNGGGGH